MVDTILGKMLAELGPNTKVIATGGEARVICPESRHIQEIDEHLTLDGLRLIWEKNNAGGRAKS